MFECAYWHCTRHEFSKNYSAGPALYGSFPLISRLIGSSTVLLCRLSPLEIGQVTSLMMPIRRDYYYQPCELVLHLGFFTAQYIPRLSPCRGGPT